MSGQSGFSRSLCVYCASAGGTDPRYLAAAAEVGSLLARRRIRLVYGGASVGCMGAVANACLDEGGIVLGIITEALAEREVANRRCTELRIVSTMHQRKTDMIAASDGVLALPGGFGTLDELFEALSWRQLGIHGKPVGLLNVAGFFDHLIAHLDASVSAGLLQPSNRRLLIASDSPQTILDRLITDS